jgi:hypothetical protein
LQRHGAQSGLGCYTTAGTITLIQGWNWYAGADPTLIGTNQYDFQTTVTHELGHALGLGESSTTTSAMYGTLAPATAIRTLTTADLNIPYAEAGADAQRAAVVPVSGSVSGPSMTPASGANLPGSSAPSSAVDQLLSSSDLARLLGGMLHAYQAELSSLQALWQHDVTLFVQRFDALLSMGYGARKWSTPWM